jgi:glycosyltransferase involved in cell wall biosynthesis
MRLLIITQKVDKDDPAMGFFHNWILKIAQHADRVFVIATSKGSYDLPKHVTVFSLGKERNFPRPLRYLIFCFYTLWTLPRAGGVFVHMCPEYALAIRPLNFFFRKKIVLWYAHAAVSRIAKMTLPYVDTILTPSSESFLYPAKQVISTGHGIDTNIFSPSAQDETLSGDARNEKTILTVSRISTIKNIELLLKAIHILSQKGVAGFRVKIVGDPARPEDYEYHAALKKQADEYNISRFITWIPGVTNHETPALYRHADVFVRMQTGGGFGKTELEALSCGTPIIVPTPVYNALLPDYVSDIYYTDNSSEELADKIERILSWSKEQRERFRTDGRNVVLKHHNLDNLSATIAKQFS